MQENTSGTTQFMRSPFQSVLRIGGRCPYSMPFQAATQFHFSLEEVRNMHGRRVARICVCVCVLGGGGGGGPGVYSPEKIF